jgi:zinc transport system ATP-binding protein
MTSAPTASLEPRDPPLVACRRLDYAAGQRLALKQVELSVAPGETLGIIGPNGGGKTTLIRLIAGLLTPTRGEVRVAGLNPADACRHGNIIGYLPQLPQLDRRLPLSVHQLVELGLAGKLGIMGSPGRDDHQSVDELIERVGLAESRHAPISALSGGQLQLALIARALVCRPRLLLLDEPTTGIDALAQDRFVELLQELKQLLGLTIILASHDLRVIAAIADAIACLNVSMHVHRQKPPLSAEIAHALLCHYGVSLLHDSGKASNRASG